MLKTAGIMLIVVILIFGLSDNSFTENAASVLYDLGKYEAALPLYEREAEKGSGQAAYLAGYMHYNGLGTAVNKEKAVDYFEKAAGEDVASAMTLLGYIYGNDENFPTDHEKEFMYYQMAAAKGDGYGMYNLGVMYGWGKSMERDAEKAREWLTKASEKGVKEATDALDYLNREEDEKNRAKEILQGTMRMDVVNELRDLGIDIPDQTLKEIEESWAGWNQYYIEGGMFPVDYYGDEFPVYLLIWLGMGDEDTETGEWMPSSSDVYAFDAERDDIENMYHMFLQGITAIVPGFEVTDVCEKIEEYEETGSFSDRMKQAEETGIWPAEGITTVSFCLNGHTYQRELGFYGDWIDGNAIDWMNEVLEQENYDGRIHCYDDGGQGYILLYGTQEFAQRLEEIIGKQDICMMNDK